MRPAVRVVILGGGTAGWMTAAGLTGMLRPGTCDVHLIESEEIGTVGVGEATLPQIRSFNDAVGVIEADMMRRAQATFKLGIEFVDWGALGSSFVHPFGAYGRPLGGVAFQHQWIRSRLAGGGDPLEAFSFAIQAARANRFDFPDADTSSVASTFDYAYHFDAGLYAAHLRSVAERGGVRRIEGKVAKVLLNGETGAVVALEMEGGARIEGDLFVDCSGFRALIAGEALGSAWEDWSPWLPCDRAWAVPSEPLDPLPPYTRATAQAAGWQWRIPLQHRTGNGHIFASAFMSEGDAANLLMRTLPTDAIGTPRLLRFTAGRRLAGWTRNCVAIGLSSGFLEPLESTSIYLIQRGIEALVRLFPNNEINPGLAAEFNRQMDVEYSRIRDFLILHYHVNRRDDSEFWRHCRSMPVPESLTDAIALFRHRGHIGQYKDGLFSPPSWLSVLVGQGIEPSGYNPLADTLAGDALAGELELIRSRIARGVRGLQPHAEFIEDYCPAMARAGSGAA